MNAISFRRARRPEQKAERKQSLLSTARLMLASRNDLTSLSLNELARQAGMAKSNMYRYFESREALLLELLELEWRGWAEEFTAALGDPRDPTLEVSSVVGSFARLAAERPLLCGLTAALPSVLEHNVSVETIRSFKLETLKFLGEVAQLLSKRCPALSAEQHAELIQHALTIITGLWPYANPSDAVRQACEDPQLEPLRHEFRRDFERSLLLTARGMLA